MRRVRNFNALFLHLLVLKFLTFLILALKLLTFLRDPEYARTLVYILQGSASRRVRKKIRLRRKMKDCCTWWSIGSRRGGLNKQIAMYFMSSKLYIEGYLYYYDHLVATPLTTKGRSWHVHRRCPPSPVLGNSESRSHLSHVNPLYKASV